MGVTSGKKARTHALRTLVSEVISHAHVRPHIARVRARRHLHNPYLGNNPLLALVFSPFHRELEKFYLVLYLDIFLLKCLSVSLVS